MAGNSRRPTTLSAHANPTGVRWNDVRDTLLNRLLFIGVMVWYPPHMMTGDDAVTQVCQFRNRRYAFAATLTDSGWVWWLKFTSLAAWAAFSALGHSFLSK